LQMAEWVNAAVKAGGRAALVDALSQGPEIACGSVLVTHATPVLFVYAPSPEEEVAGAGAVAAAAGTLCALAIAAAARQQHRRLSQLCVPARETNAPPRAWELTDLVVTRVVAAGLEARAVATALDTALLHAGSTALVTVFGVRRWMHPGGGVACVCVCGVSRVRGFR
jgi:hypothetical protein